MSITHFTHLHNTYVIIYAFPFGVWRYALLSIYTYPPSVLVGCALVFSRVVYCI